MRIRLDKQNINYSDSLDRTYNNTLWRENYKEAYDRINRVIRYLPFYKQHLDIGCADGYFTCRYLRKYPASKGWAIDLSKKAIEIAANCCRNANFINGDIMQYEFKNDFFNFIHLGQSLAHFEQPDELINKIYNLLMYKGIFVVTTVNEQAGDDPEHLWKWDMTGVKEMCSKFEIVEESNNFMDKNIIYLKLIKL